MLAMNYFISYGWEQFRGVSEVRRDRGRYVESVRFYTPENVGRYIRGNIVQTVYWDDRYSINRGEYDVETMYYSAKSVEKFSIKKLLAGEQRNLPFWGEPCKQVDYNK